MKKKFMREEKNILFLTRLKTAIQKLDKKKGQLYVGIGVFFLMTLLGNLISSFLYNLQYVLPMKLPMQNIFGFHPILYPWIYLTLYLAGIGLFFYFWFRIKVNYESLEEGNKATQRLTTDKEIVAQYVGVPISARTAVETYPGPSGTIVKRIKDKVYIDQGPAHNFILGRSRSAKGQTKVLPDMDVYSRSEEKPHLVYASGKYELAVAGMGKGTLQKRGYECSVLNLIDLDRSLQYNPLELVKDAYMNGQVDEAIELCKTFSYPLYHNEEAKEPIWEETAMALVNAIILALCYEFIEKSEDPSKTEKYITMYAVSNMLAELGTVDESGGTLLDKYFDNLPAGNPAKLEYSTVKYADGQMRASIFSTTQAKLRNFIAPKVAKMMARSTFDFKKLTKDSTPINFTDQITVKGKVDPSTAGEYSLTYEITNEFNETFQATRRISIVEGTEYQTFPNSNEYFKGIDHVEMPPSESFDPRAGVTCWYYYKPQAVFLVLPDYIQTNYIIASTWISQLYHVASEYASSLEGGKLLKRIRLGLDEFGNLPGFSNISSMLSVGAGRGILIDFYVQHPNQLTMKYSEKVGEFIQDEAMNKFLLMTGSKKAREDFSALLGEEEVTMKSRSGGLFDINKQFTETVDTRPLFAPAELGRLEEGEVIVDRSIHRKDLNGNKIRPYPIFNTGEDGSLLYAHTYLYEYFDPDGRWQDLDLPHVPNIELEEYSRSFVQRIKNPLAQQEIQQNEEEQRREIAALMEKPEAILDEQYKGVSGHKIAANLSSIPPVHLPEERVSLIEKYGENAVFTIHSMLEKANPERLEQLDQLEYYEEYVDYLEKLDNNSLLEKLQFLGYFTEQK